MPSIRLERLAKTFANGTEALADLSLEIADGAFVALLGPSGCGKSTLLRLIAGLDDPTAGRIDWPDGRPDIGFVFQTPTLMAWASAQDNVALPLELRGQPRAEARARARIALAQVGLAGFEQALPRELSGGMQMRVSIARALIAEPRVLLMDEPFAALDELTRMRLDDDLLRLWAKLRFTAVFVTHSVFEGVYLAQRLLVLSGRPGRLAADIPNPTGYPRDNGYRTSAALGRMASAILATLRADRAG